MQKIHAIAYQVNFFKENLISRIGRSCRDYMAESLCKYIVSFFHGIFRELL